MRSSQPPKAATWLLRHLGCSSQNEAVIGDLIERYHRGHSRGWYWWQVVAAIVAGFATEVRLNKLYIFQSLLVGTAFQIALFYGMRILNHQIPIHRVWEHPNLFLALDVLILFAACAINARVLTRLHRLHGRTVILAFVALQFLALLLPIGSVPLQSWIFEVGAAINALIFGITADPHGLLRNMPNGMTLLNAVCDICAIGVGYRVFHYIVSALIAATTLLVGGGLLREDSNGSVERTHVST